MLCSVCLTVYSVHCYSKVWNHYIMVKRLFDSFIHQACIKLIKIVIYLPKVQWHLTDSLVLTVANEAGVFGLFCSVKRPALSTSGVCSSKNKDPDVLPIFFLCI